jgi:hypothetical protein
MILLILWFYQGKTSNRPNDGTMKLGIFSLRAISLKGADKRKGKLVFTFTCFHFHLFSLMWIRRQFFSNIYGMASSKQMALSQDIVGARYRFSSSCCLFLHKLSDSRQKKKGRVKTSKCMDPWGPPEERENITNQMGTSYNAYTLC